MASKDAECVFRQLSLLSAVVKFNQCVKGRVDQKEMGECGC